MTLQHRSLPYRFPALIGAIALTALSPLTAYAGKSGHSGGTSRSPAPVSTARAGDDGADPVTPAETSRQPAAPEEGSQGDKLSFRLMLNLDAFFGLNPMLSGSYMFDDTAGRGYDLGITFYGIQWGAGTGGEWGQWTEAGLGMTFNFFDSALRINPQLGFTFGNLLSSGATEDGIVGDGIVPNMTINLNTERFEGQAYAGFYQALTDNTPQGGTTMDFIHWWTYLGYRLSPIVSTGVHNEVLFRSGGSNIGHMDGFHWIGPYVQVAKKMGGIRLSFGDDMTLDQESFSINDFYKLQFILNF